LSPAQAGGTHHLTTSFSFSIGFVSGFRQFPDVS
jgi:hypothetical protein